ncbi:Ubiquitin supergroup [Penicillium diatomitis]|uniref:Ubiquitin supergroup n=1 Tax=Penicillium diatomitis TaxID=2819901 RepID=A0A9X0BNP6_9EURO|nr:Ubiquitin supergroup [Penicillium diatomitis]KAJ5476963.1 Ubiquitin supergroup [Penicillium diatomitis]
MAFQSTPTDVSVIITAASVARPGADSEPRFLNERRITPTWTVEQVKSKLETMTGIPPGSQRLRVKVLGRPDVWATSDAQLIGDFGIAKGSEIEIHDSRPQTMRPNFTDLSSVEKYEMKPETYETRSDSVLAWKRNQKLGRFDPNALAPEESLRKQAEQDRAEITSKGIAVTKRAIILPSSPPHIRRGTIRFVGPVPTIPLSGPARELEKSGETIPAELQPLWVGIELDEPTGKNDGSVGGQRYFECPQKCGAFVKPEKVQVGDFPPLGLDDELDDLMEEI